MANTKRYKGTGTNPSNQRDLLTRLEWLGIEVSYGGKHIRLSRDGVFLQAIPSTPSCSRSILNTVSDLRRFGIDVKQMKFIEPRVATG